MGLRDLISIAKSISNAKYEGVWSRRQAVRDVLRLTIRYLGATGASNCSLIFASVVFTDATKQNLVVRSGDATSCTEMPKPFGRERQIAGRYLDLPRAEETRFFSLFARASSTHRENQAVRINVLGDSDAKHFGWLLNARSIVFGHPLVKLIEIGNLKTSTALPCMFCPMSPINRGETIAFAQSQSCSFSNEFRPSWRLEFQRNTDHVPIKRHRSSHFAYEDDRIVDTHSSSAPVCLAASSRMKVDALLEGRNLSSPRRVNCRMSVDNCNHLLAGVQTLVRYAK